MSNEEALRRAVPAQDRRGRTPVESDAIAALLLMSTFPSHDVEPFDTGPLLWWVLGLLGVALLLEFFVAVPWTAPFSDPGTWVLIGVFTGFALRVTGRRLGAGGYGGEQALRWASLAVWAAAALGGLLAWVF